MSETPTPVRCDHGKIVCMVESDGTVVIEAKDGCLVRVPPHMVIVKTVWSSK